MRKFKLLVIFILTLAAVMACIKVEQLPARPSIEFTSFEVFDTLDILGNISKGGRLLFRFEDGDGDLLASEVVPVPVIDAPLRLKQPDVLASPPPEVARVVLPIIVVSKGPFQDWPGVLP